MGKWLLLVAVAASGCASTPSAAPPAPPPETPAVAEVPPAPEASAPPVIPATPAGPRKLPEYRPSGVKEDWRKCVALEDELKSAKTVDQQAAAKKALADFLEGFPARWEGKDVPAPEACYYAVLLQKCRRYPEAIREASRYIEVAPEDGPNALNSWKLKIVCLAQSGDFDGAESELKKAHETVFKDREVDLLALRETVANAMLKGNRIDLAAEKFRVAAEQGADIEAAVQAVDCYLRLGRTEEALALARRMTRLVDDAKRVERARVLVAQVELVGKPAPGFAGAKWWKGVGRPIADADLKGKVTVVFAWNMKSPWSRFFFDRLAAMIKSLEGRPVQVVGISRLARYNPITGGTEPELTVERELEFYDMWSQQYPVTYPLAVGGYGEGALLDPWAAHVVPYYVVVGKDGIVTYVKTGKNEEHFAALREMVERALER